MYLFNDIAGLVMNNWDKVEKKPRPVHYTKQDEFFDYFKLFLIFIIGYLYFHFIIMGWNI